jgi:hypothetical protein
MASVDLSTRECGDHVVVALGRGAADARGGRPQRAAALAPGSPIFLAVT